MKMERMFYVLTIPTHADTLATLHLNTVAWTEHLSKRVNVLTPLLPKPAPLPKFHARELAAMIPPLNTVAMMERFADNQLPRDALIERTTLLIALNPPLPIQPPLNCAPPISFLATVSIATTPLTNTAAMMDLSASHQPLMDVDSMDKAIHIVSREQILLWELHLVELD